MTSGPRVSVIIPAYNYGRFIATALESAVNQTFQDIEIIIINDGSTDNTDEVVSRYLGNPKIEYVKQANSGQTVTKNNGIKISSGEFIAFLDADDWWDHTKLEKQLAAFEADDIGVVYSKSSFVSQDGRPLNQFYPDFLYTGKVTAALFVDNFVPFSSALIRRKSLERIGLFDEGLRMGIDWDLWLRMSMEYRFSAIDEPLLFYRMGHDNQMSKNTPLRMASSDRIMTKFLAANPGALSKKEIDKAWAFTFCNRGDYFRRTDLTKSCAFFARAMAKEPCNARVYKGFVKNLLFGLRLWEDR